MLPRLSLAYLTIGRSGAIVRQSLADSAFQGRALERVCLQHRSESHDVTHAVSLRG
jgi:hypothetical protein